MTHDHRDYILEIAPDAAAKTHTLHSFGSAHPEGDVLDPVGGALETYRLTRDEIESALTDLILAVVRPSTPSQPTPTQEIP
jgi:protein-tyrosine-phosphatase